MRKRIQMIAGVCLLSALLIAGGTALKAPEESVPEPVSSAGTPTPPSAATTYLQCKFYERELILGAISAPAAYQAEGRPLAAMIPHHLLAADMIAGLLSLAGEHAGSYDTVVIVAPSHFPENCGSDVVTALAGWQTPSGTAKPATALITALLRQSGIGAENNPAAVEADHGAAGLIPLVKHYLPEAEIAAVLLSNRLADYRLQAFRQALADYCADGRTLVIASVDCSHYLTPQEAEVRDRQTIDALEAFDYRAIAAFGDSNIDSPQAVSTFLKVSEALGLSLRRLGHSSSMEKLPHAPTNPIYDEGITSYLVYAAIEAD